jgi:hypothetical protein
MIYLNRQQSKILQILRACKNTGMNSYQFRMQFIQLPVRIRELKEKGFSIGSVEQGNRSVIYVLYLEPHDEVFLYGQDEMKVVPECTSRQVVMF